MNAPEFINLDLDIESYQDLTPLAEYLERNACLLSHETVGELDYITVEALLGGDGMSLEVSVKEMISVIELLPADLYRLFAEARSRVFDFGFEGGNEADPFCCDLSAEYIKQTCQHNITFRFTIYSHREEEESGA